MVTANKAALQMFPVAGGDEPERDIQKIFGMVNQHLIDVIKRVHESRASVVEYDVDLHLDNGVASTVNLNVLPLTDGEDDFQGVVVVLEDITNEKRVKSAFSHYLGPAVIEQLLADPKRLSLGGEKREMTFLFTDIAGFTVVVKLLNEYFDEMCGIVLDHGGTIDKIVGDALHVMFNAPTDQFMLSAPCDAHLIYRPFAKSLCNFRQTSRSHWAKPDWESTPVQRLLVILAVRFDYTAYGDTINTAARLEGANKYLGTRICVSEETKLRSIGTVFRPVGRLVLKGKTEAIQVFEPLHPEAASPDKLNPYLRAYELMEKLDPLALATFEDLAKRFSTDRLVAYHARRLAEGESGATIVMSGK